MSATALKPSPNQTWPGRRAAKHRAPETAPLGRDFALLCVGQTVSQVGSRGFGVAIALWALAATGSAAIVGLASSVTVGVFTAAQLPAGRISDRFDRRRVMLVCDVGSALAVGSLVPMAFQLPLVLVVVSVLAISWAMRGTAENAAVPNTVDDAQLPRAITLIHGRGYATGIAGPLLAGGLFVIAPTLPFLLDACSYLVAAGCAALVRRPLRADPRPGRVLGGPADGFRTIWRQPYLRLATLVTSATGFVISCSGLILVIVLYRHGVQPSTVGLAVTATYVGGLAGTVLTRAGGCVLPPHSVIVTGLAVGALATGLLVTASPVAVGVGCCLLLLAQPLWGIPLATGWARLVPDESRGRADAAIGLVVAIPSAVAPAIVGIIVEIATPAMVGLLLTALIGVTALVAATGLRPGRVVI